MATFRITANETIEHTFEVDAANEEEAEEIFKEQYELGAMSAINIESFEFTVVSVDELQ